jgi:hypothetical protein
VATDIPVTRSDEPCLEAVVAAKLTSVTQAEARLIGADLRSQPLRDLAPDPDEGSTFVDHMSHSFTSPDMADRFLRGITSPEDVIHLPVPGPVSREQHAQYALARTLRVVRQAGDDMLPGLAMFGQGDGLGHRQQGNAIRNCLRRKEPFAVVKPFDNLDRFLGFYGEDTFASVAIVARGPQHVAISVATGSTVAVGSHHVALVQRDTSTWIRMSELSDLPVLHSSIAAPPGTPIGDEVESSAFFPESGNATLLNGVLLGGIEAAYQPDSWPWDVAASYIAAAAGRTVVQASGGPRSRRRTPLTAADVQSILVKALTEGEKVPGLVIARGELAAHRLINHLRQGGIA